MKYSLLIGRKGARQWASSHGEHGVKKLRQVTFNLPVAIANPFSFHPDYIAAIIATAGALWLTAAAITLLTARQRREAGPVICRLACWIFLPAAVAVAATFVLPNTPTYLPGFPRAEGRTDRREPFAILVAEARANDRILIHRNGTEITEVHVPPDCPIEREGKPESFTAIQPGYVVEGIWSPTDLNKYSASRITNISLWKSR